MTTKQDKKRLPRNVHVYYETAAMGFRVVKLDEPSAKRFVAELQDRRLRLDEDHEDFPSYIHAHIFGRPVVDIQTIRRLQRREAK